jgi:hypothetical protein
MKGNAFAVSINTLGALLSKSQKKSNIPALHPPWILMYSPSRLLQAPSPEHPFSITMSLPDYLEENNRFG